LPPVLCALFEKGNAKDETWQKTNETWPQTGRLKEPGLPRLRSKIGFALSPPKGKRRVYFPIQRGGKRLPKVNGGVGTLVNRHELHPFQGFFWKKEGRSPRWGKAEFERGKRIGEKRRWRRGGAFGPFLQLVDGKWDSKEKKERDG